MDSKLYINHNNRYGENIKIIYINIMRIILTISIAFDNIIMQSVLGGVEWKNMM